MTFNAEKVETVFETFLYHCYLKNLVKDGTCFKNPERLSYIDLFLTNSLLSLKLQEWYSQVFMAEFKTTFTNSKPKETKCRDYKAFN